MNWNTFMRSGKKIRQKKIKMKVNQIQKKAYNSKQFLLFKVSFLSNAIMESLLYIITPTPNIREKIQIDIRTR